MSNLPNTPQLSTLLPAEFLRRGLSLGQLLAIFMAYRRQILIAAVAGLVLTGLFSKLVLSRAYDATATVLVDYEVNTPDTDREFPSMLAASYMTTQTSFISSAAVLGPVLDQLGWMNDAEKSKGFSGSGEALREHLMWKVLGQGLGVTNPRDNRFIYISYRAKSPDEAAKVANAVANTYVREHGNRLREPARQRAEEYLKSVDELKARFVKAQEEVAAFRKRTGLIDIGGKGQMEEERLREINSALLIAEADRRNASIRERQVSRLGRQIGDADVEFAQSPGVVRIKADLLTAESRFLELQKSLGPRHPDYIVAESLVRDLRAKLSQEVSGFAGGVVNNATTAAGQSSALVNVLRERIDEETDKLLSIRGQQDEAARLLAELDAAEKVYKLTLDQYGQIVRNAATQYNDVSLVAPAVPPARHTKPRTSVNVVLGFFGGLICAALAALLWELTHRRVRCAEDVEIEFGEPPLAVIGERKA